MQLETIDICHSTAPYLMRVMIGPRDSIDIYKCLKHRFHFYVINAKIPLVCNGNMNDKCEWWMPLGDRCRFPCARHVLLYSGPVYEGISRPAKHSHSDWSLHVAIHFVTFAVHIHIPMNGITPILILCDWFFWPHSHLSFALRAKGILA